MSKEEKNVLNQEKRYPNKKTHSIQNLVEKLAQYNIVYFVDISNVKANLNNKFRSLCYPKGVKVLAVKNSLLAKAMQEVPGKTFTEIYDKKNKVLVGQTALLFSETANLPARLIQELGVKSLKLKAAYVDGIVYIGEDQLQALVDFKSKEELIADIIAMLQAPIKNVLSALENSHKETSEVSETFTE
jgi:large subunit ribosomal protein L10